jgi:hypothetical protein
MSVTVHIGVGDDESVRVPLLGDLPALLQGVRNALDVERDVDTLGQLQLRIQGGALLTEENFGDLTDGDSLELLIIQGSRMPPLQLLSSPGKSERFSHLVCERIGIQLKSLIRLWDGEGNPLGIVKMAICFTTTL